MSVEIAQGRTPEEEANIATAEAHVRAYNSKEEGWFDRFYADEVAYHTYGPWAPHGQSADRKHLEAMAMGAMQIFPDRTMTVKSMVAEGDTVAIEATSSGKTFRGDQYSQEYHFVMRARDGKITEWKEYMDTELARKILVGA